MRIDGYTKAVLTVIAGCLVWLCVRDVGLDSAAYAQGSSGIGGVTKVKIVGIDFKNMEITGPLTDALPVTVVAVERKSGPGNPNALPVETVSAPPGR